MKRIIPVLLVLMVCIPTVLPLFSEGYFPMHDDTQVTRVVEMGKALHEGQFPVRWVSDLGYGYGYPIFNFYGPLPYYAGGALYALGVPALTATKTMMGVGVVAPALIMYIVMTLLTGWQAGVLSSVLYLYAPYHAVQIYVRGAVGEYWILIFWPILLYGMLKKNVIVGSIGLAGAVLSHTLMGYVTVLFSLVGLFNKHRLWIILLGLGLSAFFWLPALTEMKYTNVSGQIVPISDHFVCLPQIWSSIWGYGGSAPGCIDGMSFMIGKIHILILALNLLVLRRTIIGVFLGLIGIFLTTEYSAFLWKLIPGFVYMQYPWRFLAVSGFGIALSGGSLVARRTVAAIGLAALIVIMNVKWFKPQYTYQKQSEEFEKMSDIRWRASKVSDEYMPKSFIRPKTESEVIFDTINGNTFIVEATSASEVVVQKAYFPGWRYMVNGEDVKPRIENGLPVIPVSAGKSVIELMFTDTPIRKLGNLISFASLIRLGIIIYGTKRKPKR